MSKRISVRAAKSKGRKLQNFVRDVFRDIFRDKLEAEDIESRQMGGSGVDVILTPAAKKLIPFDIECKNVEKFSINASLKQCELNSSEGRSPLLVFSKNRDNIYVSLKFEDFIKLLYPEWQPNIEIKGKTVIQKSQLLQDSIQI